MSAIVKVGSTEEWQALLDSSDVVISDFYADWCGPCKVIAPHFEKLAARLSHAPTDKGDAPSRPTVAFAKVNVDQVQAVARECKVNAMPTFLIYRSGKLHDVVQGANLSKLTTAVEAAVTPGEVESTEAAQKWADGQPPSAFSLSSLLPLLLMLFFWYYSRK